MLLVSKMSLKKRIFSSTGWAFFTMLVWEGVESLLEYAIAYIISNAVTLLLIKFITTFAIITATQTMVKPTQRFFLTFIKKITYRKGDDKVKTLKKIWDLFKANKCSIAVIISASLLGASGLNLINVEDLPAITLGSDQVIEAVVQEEDLIATETIYGKEAVIATETIYGKEAVIATETIYGEPIFATEVVWEKEPVYATEVVWEVEPIVATEPIYSVEPVVADKLTFVAKEIIYEDDNVTVKYNVGDIVSNADIGNHTDKLDVFSAGDIIKEGVVLYNEGDIIKEGVVKHNIGDVVEEGIIKYNVGEYIGNEILYNEGDVIVPAEILYNVGDVIEPAEILYNEGDIIVPAGTILEEEQVIPATNITPYLYYLILSICVAIAGVFFEKPEEYTERKETTKLEKQAKKEIAEEENKFNKEQEIIVAEQKQKVVNAEKQKAEEEKRLKLEKIKAEIRASKAN